ncbi:hypothetical protein ScPMuIL_015005 [Solemya velum]
MTAFLPPNLLALFAARDPLPFLPPHSKLGVEKKRIPYSGIAQCVSYFEDPKDTPPPTRVETKDERKERKRKERAEQIAYKLEQDLALWDPHGSNSLSTDPFKSLFVARINYDTSESKLRREFEVYGPVRKINLVHDVNSGKPRGFAFIEYEHERDMHSAYKHADGKKIDGRRVLVDVERGRTVKGWRPRRLGGGLGGTRKGGPEENTRFSGRDDFGGGTGAGAGAGAGYRDERSPTRGGRGRRSRSRDRGERPEREPRRRSRSREREPRRRSRSRDRTRRDRSKDRDDDEETRKNRRRRSRSRERKRSRSRDRRKSRRSRSRERRDRREGGGGGGDEGDYPVKIKEEKEDAGYAIAAGITPGSGSAPIPDNEAAMDTNGYNNVNNQDPYEA